MNAQLTAAIRQAITALSAFAIGAGWTSAEQAGAPVELATALILVASIGWSLWASRKTGVVAAAAKIPEVTEIVMRNSSTIPDTLPSAKVTHQGDARPHG